jgi:hypothetical protein
MTDAIKWNRLPFLPGWILIQARRDGYLMQKDQYGLLTCNDPDFIFDGTPKQDPTRDMSDEELNNDKTGVMGLFNDWVNQVIRLEKSLVNVRSPDCIISLYRAAKKGGYKKKHGRFGMWLMNKLAKHIETYDPVHHGGSVLPFSDEETA